MQYINTMEYYSAINKNEIVPFVAPRINLEIIILSEVSHTKTNIIYHLFVKSKKIIQMNIFRNRNSHIEIKLMIIKAERGKEIN